MSANHNLFFLFFTLLLILWMMISSSSAQQKEVDQFYFPGFSGADKNITLTGPAAKLVNTNGGIIQLTNSTSRLMAHAFYTRRIPFKQNGAVRSFSTAFTFASVPVFKTLGGHGYAFVIAPALTTLDVGGIPAQYLGIFNTSNNGNLTNHIFAVEFDTAKDLEFRDIDDNHVGVDLNSLISNHSATAGYYSDLNSTFVNVTLKSGATVQAWIDYDSAQSLLNVTISPFASKPARPLFSINLDLSSVLDDYMYVGFSAATGLLASSHYLLGWSFNMTGPARSLPLFQVPLASNSAHTHRVLAISLSLSFSIILVIALATTVYFIRKIRNADVIEDWERTVGPHRYSYKDLKLATKGFRDKELLGRGGFGRVYMAVLPKSKTLVAVKRVSHESKQGLKEFVAEIATIGRLRHRNLVQLLGWCRHRGDLMLVYDYMPNGSLDKYLFNRPRFILDWDQRFRIVRGVASGLFYLHEGWDQVVIHRDIKASNILLDSELNGRVGDFGLARLHDHGSNLTTTRVVGTLGYLAPELPKSGKATTASDVFAFGTLLLEVVCGRRPIEPKASQDELVLVDWVWDHWTKGNVASVVDRRLEGRFDQKEAVMVLKLGLMCSCDAPHHRPTMKQVVSYLEEETPLPDVLMPPSGPDNFEGFGISSFVHSFASTSRDMESSSSGAWTVQERSSVPDNNKSKSNQPASSSDAPPDAPPSRFLTW